VPIHPRKPLGRFFCLAVLWMTFLAAAASATRDDDEEPPPTRIGSQIDPNGWQ
jgi:hypothetical protein